MLSLLSKNCVHVICSLKKLEREKLKIFIKKRKPSYYFAAKNSCQQKGTQKCSNKLKGEQQ